MLLQWFRDAWRAGEYKSQAARLLDEKGVLERRVALAFESQEATEKLLAKETLGHTDAKRSLELLRGQVREYQSKITELDSQVFDLKGEVAAAADDSRDLRLQVEAAEALLATANAEIDLLKKPKTRRGSK